MLNRWLPSTLGGPFNKSNRAAKVLNGTETGFINFVLHLRHKVDDVQIRTGRDIYAASTPAHRERFELQTNSLCYCFNSSGRLLISSIVMGVARFPILS